MLLSTAATNRRPGASSIHPDAGGAGGSLLSGFGLAAVALGHGSSFLVLTLTGAVAYVGVNVVTTAHRALVHDCFESGRRTGGNGAQEVAS